MLIPLKLLHDQPLQQQLYDQLRELIVTARLAAGVRMPSSRMLADQFTVSRMTVLLTYERLIAEGYLETVPAVGTFVSKPTALPAARKDTHEPETIALPVASSEYRIGQPDPSLFPTGRWRALIRSTLERLGTQLGHPHPAGNPALRAAIARWLSTSRGLAVQPEQVIIVGGRQQTLHIASHLLLRAGDRVVVEDPCEEAAANLFAATHAEIVRVPIDADGLCTDRLPDGPAALIHVTPEHHRPLGATLSAARRCQLLAWAARSGAMVLEEDSQGEFRYASLDAAPLMSLDREQQVVHAGCFASALGPWLTLGYLVVPHRLIAPALTARRLIDDHALWLEEGALAELLDSGAYARHVHRLRKIYLGRRDALIESMQKYFGGSVRLGGTHAGLHLAWRMPEGFGTSAAVAAMARRCGLQAAPLANTPFVLLGFAMPAERLIAAGVAQLAARLHTGQRALLAAGIGAD
jgi:GntR family transcriptional regulator/MocR family aminotransferase